MVPLGPWNYGRGNLMLPYCCSSHESYFAVVGWQGTGDRQLGSAKVVECQRQRKVEFEA